MGTRKRAKTGKSVDDATRPLLFPRLGDPQYDGPCLTIREASSHISAGGRSGNSDLRPEPDTVAAAEPARDPPTEHHDDHRVVGFGEDPLNPYTHRPIEIVSGKSKRALRDQVSQLCPPVPGVYGMFDRHGDLIYVGKSQSLRTRLLNYFSDSARREKGGRIIRQARAIQWETQPSDFAARVRELGLIRKWTPRMNVQGVPQRQRPVYIALGRKPAEMFYLSTSPPGKDVVAVEGPFYGIARMSRVVEALNKTFGLRDCSQQTVFQFAEQMSLFDRQPRAGCLRLEIGTCLGPCAAACSRQEYMERVNAAESFLDGFNDEPIIMIQDTMEAAAASQQYELAARARDTLKSLQYATKKLGYLAHARQSYSFVYAATGYDGQAIWYLVRRGEIADVAPAPTDRDAYVAMKPRLQTWSTMLRKKYQRVGTDHPHTVSIVASWFRQHRGELKQTFAPEKAGHHYHRAKRLHTA
ncbi:MAG: UvrB/UvrC motif-containing protein [Planctomycetota bacterium]